MTQKDKSLAPYFAGLTAVFFLFANIHCGQKVCVAGIGDCATKGVTQTLSGTGTKLKLTADTSPMKAGEQRPITIEGGAGDVTLTITGTGSFMESKITGGRITYRAADTVSSGGDRVHIVARDSVYKDDASDPERYHWTYIDFTVFQK